jgi:hypothetical protein
MKKIVHISFLFLLVSIVQAQDSENRILLGLFTPHWDNFEYLNGNVKEIHYQSYHISDNEGETIKGEPFTDEEAEGTAIRRAWSLYFDQEGNMIYMKRKINDDNIQSAVIHSVNNRIENIYWIRNDSLINTVDVIYDKQGNVETYWKAPQDIKFNKASHYVLDKNRHVIKADFYYPPDTIFYTEEFSRYPDGTIKEKKGIDTHGKLKHHYTGYKYNDHGLFEYNDIELLNYKDPEYPDVVAKYEYDDNDNWIKRIHPDWMMIERKIVYYK